MLNNFRKRLSSIIYPEGSKSSAATGKVHKKDLKVHNNDRAIIKLVCLYAKGYGLSESYSARILTGSGGTVNRIKSGMSLTARRSEAIAQTASNNWPSDLAWPADIPRPTPKTSEAA